MNQEKELERLSHEPGSMVFALLVGMIVDYEQTQLADETAKSRYKRSRAQMAIVRHAENQIRKVCQLGLMDELLSTFAEKENVEPGKPVSIEKQPVTYQLSLMRKELMSTSA